MSDQPSSSTVWADGAPVRPSLPAFVKLVQLYEARGFRVHTGLNPAWFVNPDVAFTHFSRANGEPVQSGWGIAPIEVAAFEWLALAGLTPRRVFVVGNGFGWSTLLFAMLWPTARVVAIDACIEGDADSLGMELTRSVAQDHGWNVRAVRGVSPRDVPDVLQAEFDGPVDFAFIDGLHADEQQLADFDALSGRLSADAIVAVHDIVSWRTFASLKEMGRSSGREVCVLMRTPSGLGLLLPASTPAGVRSVVAAMTEQGPAASAVLHAADARLVAAGPSTLPEGFRFSPGILRREIFLARSYLASGQTSRAIACYHEATRTAEVAFDAWRELSEVHLGCGEHEAAAGACRQALVLRPDAADAVHCLGRALVCLHRPVEARRAFERAVELAPDWFPPRHDLGLLARAGGDLTDALRWFDTVTALVPDWPDVHVEIGVTAFAAGAFERAATAFGEALQCRPAWSAVLHERGRALRRLGRASDAEVDFKAAAALDPEWFPPRHELGLLQRERGNLDMARLAFEEVVRLAPECADGYYELGRTYQALQLWERARWALGEAHVRAGTWPEACHEYGRACKALGDRDTALARFEEAAGLAPHWFAPHHELGLLARDDGDLDGAAARLEAALARAPECPDVHYELAMTEVARQRYAEGVQHFERAVEAGFVMPRLFHEFGRALHMCGRRAEARQALTRARADEPSWFAPWHQLGVLTRDEGDGHGAADCFAQAEALAPGMADPPYELGRTLTILGRIDEARAALMRAEAVRPDWFAVAVARGELAQLAGDLDEALAHWARAERLGANGLTSGLQNEASALRERRIAAEAALSRAGLVDARWNERFRELAAMMAEHEGE